MPEIGTFGLMSGDGKRSVGHRPQATAPILKTLPESLVLTLNQRVQGSSPLCAHQINQ